MVDTYFQNFLEMSAIILFLSLILNYFLKNWKIKHNELEIVTKKYATLNRTPVHYALTDMVAISCSKGEMVHAVPFDKLVLEFRDKRLTLRMSDWRRESLKQFVCDLMSYRNDLPRDQRLLDFIAGEYDDAFVEHG